MPATPYSVVMAMIWFTLASLVGYFILRRAEKCGLAFIGMVFLLTTIRIFVPLDIAGSIIIRSHVVYPAIQNWMRCPIVESITVGDCLVFLWAAGAVFRFIGLVRKWTQQRKFRQEAAMQDGDDWLSPLFQKVAEELGYHGAFHLAAGEHVSSVYQTGFLHPYILLPTQIDMFSDEDICNMFRHELCHFLSRDLWIKVGFQVIGCILWWNPVMPMLKRSIEQLLELRCDRKVCRQLSAESQLSYMETLIELVKLGSTCTAQTYMGCLGRNSGDDMQQRFGMLLLNKPSTTERCRQIISCVLCLVLFIASYGVILQPWNDSPGSDDFGGDIFELASDDGYIVCSSDGTLVFYFDGTDQGITIQEAMLSIEPFSQMPIIYETKG